MITMDAEFYKQNAKNKNTTKATEVWFRKYCNWAEENSETNNDYLLLFLHYFMYACHAINKLTHDFSTDMDLFFLDFLFFVYLNSRFALVQINEK